MDVPAGRSLVPEIAGSNPASATLPWRAKVCRSNGRA